MGRPWDEAESRAAHQVAGGSRWRFHEDVRAEMVTRMDMQVGQRAEGRLRRRDRGTIRSRELSPAIPAASCFADTWPFTGKKTELLEGGLRIPGGSALAGSHSRGEHDGSGGDHDGLDADAAGVPPGRNLIRALPLDGAESFAAVDAGSCARFTTALTGATTTTRSAPCAKAT